MTNRPPIRRAVSIGGAISCIRHDAGDTRQVGRVVGSFPTGFYVRFDQAICAVGSAAIRPGPLHLTVAGGVPAPLSGASVEMSSERIRVDQVEIDLTSGHCWSPPRLPPEGLATAGRFLTVSRSTQPIPAELDDVWPDVERAMAVDDLDGALEHLQGRGTGLTPSGDDVLAGLLLMESLFHPDYTRAPAVAAAARTTDLSRSFLHWAARGQSIEPVHCMLSHAAAGRHVEAHDSAATVAGTGSSSGRALLAGLGLAAASR